MKKERKEVKKTLWNVNKKVSLVTKIMTTNIFNKSNKSYLEW